MVRRFKTRWLKLLFFAFCAMAFGIPEAKGVCVAPIPPLPPATTAIYQNAVVTWVQRGCFKQWQSDPKPRLSGSTAGDGTSYTTHDQIQVWYSPAMVAWMKTNRPDGSTVPPNPTSIPDGAAMVAVVTPLASTTPSGYLVMIRQAKGRPDDPASGWFFSQVIASAATWGGTRVATSMGDFSMGLCVACHSSAVSNLTFASYSNLSTTPVSPAYTAAFVTQSTTSLLSALTPPASPQLRQPLGDSAAKQFIDFYNSAVSEFQMKPLPPPSSLPASKVLVIPGQDTDDVYLRNKQTAFVTSNQCQGCHDSTALLSAQLGGARHWTG